MYKVMLVDDDVPMLDYLQSLVDWSKLGFDKITADFSARKALDRFHNEQPDLVITDIGMPHMNGLELSRKIKAVQPNVRIIFLTCHEDFSFSKEAFQLEADDYLLKDELTADRLAQSVSKALKVMQALHADKEKQSFQADLHRNRLMLKTDFLDQLLKGNHPKHLIHYGERLGIFWMNRQLRMAEIRLDYAAFLRRYRPEDLGLIQYAMYNIAEDIAPEHGQWVPFIWDKDRVLVVTADLSSQQSFSLLRSVAEHIKTFLQLEVYMISDTKEFKAELLGQAWIRLKKAARNAYYDESRWLTAMDGQPTKWPPYDRTIVELDYKHWFHALRKQDALTLEAVLRNLERKLYKLPCNPVSLRAEMAYWLRTAGYEMHRTLPDSCFQWLEQSGRWAETAALLKQLSNMLLTPPEPGLDENKGEDLLKIDRYIMERLHENVTSADIAELLHLHPNYFPRYFKRITGMNFTDYVHRFKVNIAGKMLEQPEETAENVAYSLGYSDRAYFSKIFKKYTGFSPGEYKNSKNSAHEEV